MEIKIGSVKAKRVRPHGKNFVFEWAKEIDEEKIKTALGPKFAEDILSVKSEPSSTRAVLLCKKVQRPAVAKRYSIDGIDPSIKTLNKEVYNLVISPLPQTEMKTCSDYLEAYLTTNNKECLEQYRQLMESHLANIQILLYSEYLLSIIVGNQIIEIGKKMSWRDFKIVSLDCKMEYWSEELNDKKLKNFRCDVIFYMDKKLIIMEFKFRKDRSNNQAIKALRTISDRDYTLKVLLYLQKNDTELFSKICYIQEIGLSYSSKNNCLNVGILDKQYKYSIDSSLMPRDGPFIVNKSV